MENKFASPEYRRSRAAYNVKCATEYLVTLLVEDAFLSKLLKYLDLSDSQIGVVSSFLTFAFLAKLITLPLKRTKLSSKKLVFIFDGASLLFFATLYAVPFLPIGTTPKKVAVMAFVIGAYVFMYAVSSICFKWANSFVEPHTRGSYSATKECTSLVAAMIFTLAVSYCFDRLNEIGKIETAFALFVILMVILAVSSLVSVLLISKGEEKEDIVSHKFSDVIKNSLGNKNYRNVIILMIMIEVGRYFTYGFMGIFKTGDLAMTLFTTQMISTAAKCVRLIITKPFGRYSDKKGFANGMQLGLLIVAAAFFVNIFTTKKTWWMVIAFTVLYEASLAGVNQNIFNISYNYVKTEYLTEAIAIKEAISGLFAFTSSVVAGSLLDKIQSSGNMLFGIHVYGQQVLSVISFLIIIAAYFFCKKVVCKQPVMVQ